MGGLEGMGAGAAAASAGRMGQGSSSSSISRADGAGRSSALEGRVDLCGVDDRALATTEKNDRQSMQSMQWL